MHILEVARSIMFTNHVPKYLWGEAILTVTYLINRMASLILHFQSPYNLLLQIFLESHILNTLPLKVFRCSTYVHIHAHLMGKLDPKALKYIFVGYSSNKKGYKCLFPDTHQFYNTIDVIFFENQSFYPTIDIQGENFTQKYQLWDVSIPSLYP